MKPQTTKSEYQLAVTRLFWLKVHVAYLLLSFAVLLFIAAQVVFFRDPFVATFWLGCLTMVVVGKIDSWLQKKSGNPTPKTTIDPL